MTSPTCTYQKEASVAVPLGSRRFAITPYKTFDDKFESKAEQELEGRISRIPERCAMDDPSLLLLTCGAQCKLSNAVATHDYR